MSAYSFKLPDIGEGIAQAEIVAWHVSVGDIVEEDAPLADLMTDKATVEMTSPVAGVVMTLAGEVGEQVAIGSVLAVLEMEDDDSQDSKSPENANPTIAAQPPEPEPARNEPASEVKQEGEGFPATVSGEFLDQPVALSTSRIQASPAVRQRAKGLGIDLTEVKTAELGRVRHADLDAFLNYNADRGYRMPTTAGGVDQTVKVIGMRRRIADNMAASKRNIPHFTYVEEFNVNKLEELRANLNAMRGARPKLTMLPLLITAICKTLPEFPMINARYDDEAGIVTRHGAVHLGMATQTDAGLMVPVIRNAERRNVWQLAAEIVRLADLARSGKAKSEELSGSTLTITSLGPLGGIATTPVINRPEVAIIGPNKVIERPMFLDGKIIATKLMNMSISCDHRVVDGWDAASFVQALKRLLETPAMLFVD